MFVISQITSDDQHKSFLLLFIYELFFRDVVMHTIQCVRPCSLGAALGLNQFLFLFLFQCFSSFRSFGRKYLVVWSIKSKIT